MSSPETRAGRHRAPRRRFGATRTVIREAGPGAIKASVTLVTVMGVAASLGLTTDGSATAAGGRVDDASGPDTDVLVHGDAPVAAATFGLTGFTAKAKPLDPTSPEGLAERIQQSASRGLDYGRKGLSYENGLSPNAIAVGNAVRANFPSIKTLGGFRPGDMDHGTGHAVDVMCSTTEGNAVAEFFQANADKYHVKYIIWRQRIWYPGNSKDAWKMMGDRGGATANHMDHVHISVN